MLENQINFENNNLDLQTFNLNQKLRFGQLRAKKNLSELEDYDLKQTIGEGGFGKVKKAVHKLTGSLVAIKIINIKAKSSEETADLEKQISIQKHILHENIAQVYEVIKKQNKIYIIMQYCKNGELFTFINKNGPLSEKNAGKIFNQILSALIYLRDNQICHRDIKPQNIMFDENWNVKLIDFGFSCRETHEEMRTTYCGTPSYNAPQMVKKLPYTGEATDVWSLGVTLYAMLAAELPFEDQNQAVKKNKVVNCKYLIKPFFSPRVQKLFSLIFVEASKRINLLNLKKSQFSQSNQSCESKFINFKMQNIVLEQIILDKIHKQYDIDPKKIIESVKESKFDKYSALYFLKIKSEKNISIFQQQQFSQFKKQRRGSFFKLNPIIQTPIIIKKQSNQNRKSVILEKGKLLTVDAKTCRLRRNVSPDSPRRLLDCLSAYKA